MAASFSPGFARTVSVQEFNERARRLLSPEAAMMPVAVKPMRRQRSLVAAEVARVSDGNAELLAGS
ncbi:hypothetical protein [Methylobacterium durans]|uniref:hypothetical protein n=1 Tax=Methylobacterium durans TaxID=2202825 RepID=UPI0013A5BD3F|nr:hypothetical protein [Methylobacterium durans]